MMLWLDDRRPAPDGWVLARSVNEAIAFLVQHEVTHASLDHDLGTFTPDGGRGVKLTDWMAEEGRWPVVGFRVHSSNPEGRKTMLATANRYGPYSWPVGATFGKPPEGGWPPADTVAD